IRAAGSAEPAVARPPGRCSPTPAAGCSVACAASQARHAAEPLAHAFSPRGRSTWHDMPVADPSLSCRPRRAGGAHRRRTGVGLLALLLLLPVLSGCLRVQMTMGV